jgi:hypothetical protein
VSTTPFHWQQQLPICNRIAGQTRARPVVGPGFLQAFRALAIHPQNIDMLKPPGAVRVSIGLSPIERR